MTHLHVLPIEQPNSDPPWAAWLQMELELDPAPILQLAAAAPMVTGRIPAQQCPLCGAALAHVGTGEQCTRCGAIVDL